MTQILLPRDGGEQETDAVAMYDDKGEYETDAVATMMDVNREQMLLL